MNTTNRDAKQEAIISILQMELQAQGLVTIIILIIRGCDVNAIIGYDCGSAAANLTTLSLINVEECDIPPQIVESSKTFIQLLQINDFNFATIIQCKVEIHRSIKKCGMFSHTMEVNNGEYSYIEEISREACQRMHTYGSFEIGGTHITGLKSNQTATRPLTLAGYVDDNGACSGNAYSDLYGSWKDVLVLGSIKITLQDYTANVRLNTNRVQLRSGVMCEFSAKHCSDIEGGDTFWDISPTDSCKISEYNVLYQGEAYKITDRMHSSTQIVYSLTALDTVFALTSTGQYMTCGHTLTRTEHPKLLIFETTPNNAIFKVSGDIANRDIFTYMNSKFVYVERHIRTQINQLYRNVLLQQCNLEQRILQNSLAIAARSPDVFAYHFMKGPGYMAFLAGEVIHIVKCVPVEVKLASVQECYEQLPILRNNQTYFLTPQTHIILRQGTQITCNSFAPSMYLLGDAWYKFMPRPVETITPTIMKPLTKPTWKYISPGALATSGIYSQDDLDQLKDHIMFPAERPAVLNTLARGVMGRSTILHGGSLTNLIDEASIEKIATSAWTKFWDKFLFFGNVSAGFIGIYLCVRGIKLLLDTFVHGYALHTVYGWSVYLIGAIWDSVTQLLLHLGKRKTNRDQENHEKGQGVEASESDKTETTPAIINGPIVTTQPRSTIYPLLPPREIEEDVSYTFEIKK